MSLSWTLSDVSLVSRQLGECVLTGTTEGKCTLQRIISRVHTGAYPVIRQYGISLLVFTFIPWLELAFVRFLQLFFPSFSITYSLEGKLLLQPTLKYWRVMLPLREGCLHELFEILFLEDFSLLSYLFNHLLKAVWAHVYFC